MTTALVTGANRGIGLEIVKQLMARGLTVYLGARDPERGEKAAAGTGARFVRLDVTDPESVRQAAASLDSLDVLVNNAAVLGGGPAQAPGSADLEDVRLAFETNVLGVITVTEAFLPLLRRSARPRIVNVSSSVGTLTGMGTSEMPIALGYPPSKAALNAVTLQYAKALRDTAIKVNAVCPGWCAPEVNGRTPAQGAHIAVTMATLADDGPTGGFYDDEGVVAW